jgi:hypothetical protein
MKKLFTISAALAVAVIVYVAYYAFFPSEHVICTSKATNSHGATCERYACETGTPVMTESASNTTVRCSDGSATYIIHSID